MTTGASSPFGTAFAQRETILDVARRHTRLLDRSDLGCVLVNAAVEAVDIAQACSEALGIALPLEPGRTAASDRGTALWLTPRSWLVQCRVDDEWGLADAVNGRFPDKLVSAAPYSDALPWMELEGPAGWDLLTEGAFVSLQPEGFSVGRVKRTLLAGIPAIVFREGETRWLLGVERSRARYFAARMATTAQACTALAAA